MKEMRITKTFDLSMPILSAGMAFVTRPELAAAVSNAGGMGFLAAEMSPPREVAELIRATHTLTSRPFGIECMSPYFTKWHLDACIADSVAVVTFLWGNPEREWIERLQDAGSQVWVKVGSLDEARRAAGEGVDALIVEAPEGGPEYVGSRLIKVLADVVEAVDVPVIASASAVDGCGLAAALMLGAEAVRCGTLFLSAAEANAESEYARSMADTPIDATLRVNLLTREWPERPAPQLTHSVVSEWVRSRREDKRRPVADGTAHARCGRAAVRKLSEILVGSDPDGSLQRNNHQGCQPGVATVFEHTHAAPARTGESPTQPAAKILERITSEALRIIDAQEGLCAVA